METSSLHRAQVSPPRTCHPWVGLRRQGPGPTPPPPPTARPVLGQGGHVPAPGLSSVSRTAPFLILRSTPKTPSKNAEPFTPRRPQPHHASRQQPENVRRGDVNAHYACREWRPPVTQRAPCQTSLSARYSRRGSSPLMANHKGGAKRVRPIERMGK